MTIENINYHLEQGKPIEPAILDGAQQIFVNAGIGYRIPCNGKGGRVFTLRHRLAREYDHATGAGLVKPVTTWPGTTCQEHAGVKNWLSGAAYGNFYSAPKRTAHQAATVLHQHSSVASQRSAAG